MKHVTIIYANRLWGEYDQWQPTHELPDGAYIRRGTGDNCGWYIVRWGSATPINFSDVPKEVRALLLIMQG